MIKLRLDNVSFSYPSKPVLQNASCKIQEGCFGIIGPNGSGKTTLLKLILDELKPDSGFIARDKTQHIAYMAQEVDLPQDETVFEAARQGAQRILSLETKLDAIESRFADPDYFANEKRLARLLDQQEKTLQTYNELGGPGLDGQVRAVLRTIGLSAHEMGLPVIHLSGGQKKLLGLARIILDNPDILLLDEPDNHLDLNGKILLQNLIQSFPGSVVIVSHDRYFLDMIVDEILDVEDGIISQFEGNYSEYMFDKRLRLQRQAAMFQAQQKEISRLEQAAKRLLMWGKVYDNEKFSKRGENILKRIDRLDKIEKPKLETEKIEIQLGGWRGSEKVLEITDLAKGFPSSKEGSIVPILSDIHLLLRYGDRVGMIGPNGAGKSLLVRLILGQLSPDDGMIYIGPSVRTGYYAQEFEPLDQTPPLLETICKAGNFSENRGVAFLKKGGWSV